MLLDQPGTDTHAPITADEAKQALANGGLFGDDASLKLVLQDTQTAENFEASKSWVMSWSVATALYQSPFTAKYWEGSMSERANIPFFTVATAVNALVPQIIQGLFYDSPPFMVEKRPGTSALAAHAIGDVLAFQCEDINFRQQMQLGIRNAVLSGTGIFKIGYETFTRTRKVYVRKQAPTVVKHPLAEAGLEDIQIHDADEDIEQKEVEEYIDRPTFEHIVNLRHVLVDPGLQIPDIRKAKYVVHRMYVTWEDLDKLRDRPGFDIPPKDKLLELFLPPKEAVEEAPGEVQTRNPLWDARATARYEETTADPFNQPLEILERWDNGRVISVLQKKLVICNDENPYGVIPFLSVGWWDVPEAFYSMGLAKTVGAEQRLQQGITNTWLDNASLSLNGVYTRVKGKSVPTQNIRIFPGKIVEVDNKDDFQPIKRLDPVPEAGQHLALSQARTEQVSGANELSTQGIAGASGHSNAARSAEGIRTLTGGSGSRIQDFVEKLTEQVFLPFLYFAHEQNSALLPLSTLRYILTEELQHEYIKEKQDIVDLLNARVKFSIRAGAKLQARRNMAQAFPLLIQFLTSPTIESHLGLQGKKVNLSEVLRIGFELADWKTYDDIVQDMSPEDQKRWQMQQQGVQNQQKFQQARQLQKEKHDQQLESIEDENIARAGREVLRHTLETAVTPEAVTGLPGGTGFGSNE